MNFLEICSIQDYLMIDYGLKERKMSNFYFKSKLRESAIN